MSKNENINLGIVQGRLSIPTVIDGKSLVQGFPYRLWEQEFNSLEELGLEHIEVINNKRCFDFNIRMCKNGRYIPYLDKISSIVFDNLIDSRFKAVGWRTKELEESFSLAKKLGIERVTVPLLEEASILEQDLFDLFLKDICLLNITKSTTKTISFETDLPPEQVLSLVERSNRFKVTYDTGNISELKYDPVEYIETLFSHIDNVHIKDKTKDGKSVSPGLGNTDFKTIFKILKSNNYSGLVTLQLARGKTGLEKWTIKKYIKWFYEEWNKV